MTKNISEQLQPIFNARSVAVIGASSAPFKWGAQTVHRLIHFGYQGAVYPIHPKEKDIQGLRAYPSVLDVKEVIDLAVITVPAERVPRSIKECVKKGIRGAIIISADFAETGARGRALQEETAEIARQGGLRFVGPNCFGLFNSSNGLNTLPTVPARGEIGFISQSGSLVHMVASVASAKGYGFSKLVSVGNQADLDVADYLEFMGEDPETKSIVIYLEGFKDGRKFLKVAREIAAKKPVVIYKTGRHPGSNRVSMSHTANMTGEDRVFEAMCRQAGIIRANTLPAAREIAAKKPVVIYKTGRHPGSNRVSMSHTANMTGEDRVFEAMCRQAGIIRANTLPAAMDMAAILTRQPCPHGNRIGIQGTGGQCMILTDTCLSLGLEVPELSDEEAEQVISGIDFPAHAPFPRNPVDFAGSHTALMDATVINNLARLDKIDAIISYRPVTFHRESKDSPEQVAEMDRKVGELLAEAPWKYGKPLILIGFDRAIQNEVLRGSEIIDQALKEAGILSFLTLEDAAGAMQALVSYANIKSRNRGQTRPRD